MFAKSWEVEVKSHGKDLETVLDLEAEGWLRADVPVERCEFGFVLRVLWNIFLAELFIVCAVPSSILVVDACKGTIKGTMGEYDFIVYCQCIAAKQILIAHRMLPRHTPRQKQTILILDGDAPQWTKLVYN